ncbi:hypothetical protein VNI00_004007 [Paramarasmius palmivorus]|uniref:Beta-xylanase n=1 Tax=Paramarasmius palmivorus TaxID=297713 RepID=A0AAW0DQ56_9AGAR
MQCIPGGSGGGTTGGGSTTTASPPTSTGTAGALNAKFVSHGKKFWGSAADPNIINNSNVQRLLRDVFGQITPENSLKWDATEGTRGQFTFTNADTIVNWAVSNGKMVRGHTLVWHAQLPTWVSNINDRNTLTSVIQTHISNVAGRYKGKIYAVGLPDWDVCNEILNEDGSLRNSVFSRVLGQDFVGIAFRAARAADPSAKLYINDYNLDNTGWSSPKVEGMVKLVNSVNAGGKIIDGIGTQTHLGSGGGAGVLAAMQRLASTGLDIAITELDIGGASSTDYVNVAKACCDYTTALSAYLNTPACVSITRLTLTFFLLGQSQGQNVSPAYFVSKAPRQSITNSTNVSVLQGSAQYDMQHNLFVPEQLSTTLVVYVVSASVRSSRIPRRASACG